MKSAGEQQSTVIPARRSREGAWIEMSVVIPFGIVYTSRSREGAWIEIPQNPTLLLSTAVAPVRERGLKSNIIHDYHEDFVLVAPVRERGLKSAGEQQSTVIPAQSLP